MNNFWYQLFVFSIKTKKVKSFNLFFTLKKRIGEIIYLLQQKKTPGRFYHITCIFLMHISLCYLLITLVQVR